MPELTTGDVQALAAAVRLPMEPGDLAEVTHRLNAFLEALAPLGDLPLDRAEPAPVAAPALDDPIVPGAAAR